MYKGIYIATSGAVLKQTQLDVISQNLANANTAGYKKDSISFKDYLFQTEPSTTPDGRDMTEYSGTKTDLSNGNTVKTGNSFDIAVEGDGFRSTGLFWYRNTRSCRGHQEWCSAPT